MKNTFITTTKDLQDWFKLENYLKVKNFESAASDWCYELTARFAIRKALQEGRNRKPHNDWSLVRSWDKIKKYGLLTYAEADDVDIRIHESIFGDRDSESNAITKKNIDEEDITCIHTLSNFEAYGFLWCDPKKDEVENKFAKSFKYDPLDSAEPNDENTFDWLTEPYACSSFSHSENMAYVGLNLNASDEQIKNNFAKWLARERKLRNLSPIKKNFSASDFTSWSEAAVLPYIDITLWAQIEGIQSISMLLHKLFFQTHMH